MKESIAASATIQEQDVNKKKTLSCHQKEGLISPEMVTSTNPSGSNNNIYTNLSTATPVIMKEPTPNITEPKQAKEESKPEEYKSMKNQEDHRKENLNNSNSFMSGVNLWQRAVIAWINSYNEFVRNAAKMNEYWFNLLWGPLAREQKMLVARK